MRISPTSILSLLALAFLLTGCPKRPMVVTSAPSASGGGTAKASAASDQLPVIRFDFDSDQIRPTDAVILDKHAVWLKSHPDELLLIAGYADDRGTPQYNVALGERRAKAAKEYLVSRGISADRMTASSMGEQRPLCTGQVRRVPRQEPPGQLPDQEALAAAARGAGC
jgi:peptidoglycan-associated lipoprotein